MKRKFISPFLLFLVFIGGCSDDAATKQDAANEAEHKYLCEKWKNRTGCEKYK